MKVVVQLYQSPQKSSIYAGLQILWIYRNLSYFTVF